MHMHWRDFNTKSSRRFSAIKNTFWHALVGPEHEIFSAICSDQEHSWICKGGTLTQNLFSDFQQSKILIDLHWWDLNTNFGDFQPSRILIDMHWWDLNTKSFWRFSAIKTTYSHALIGLKHKIFSAICSDQEYLWICIGGTLTQNLFGGLQLSRKLIDKHWWDLNTKSVRPFAAIKNTFCNAFMEP